MRSYCQRRREQTNMANNKRIPTNDEAKFTIISKKDSICTGTMRKWNVKFNIYAHIAFLYIYNLRFLLRFEPSIDRQDHLPPWSAGKWNHICFCLGCEPYKMIILTLSCSSYFLHQNIQITLFRLIQYSKIRTISKTKIKYFSWLPVCNIAR